MFVVKRDGRKELMDPLKITARVQKLCGDLAIDVAAVCGKVTSGLHQFVSTIDLDNLTVEVAAQMTSMHPDYSTLAARIAVSNLHQQTPSTFSRAVSELWNQPTCLISEKYYTFVMCYSDVLDGMILHANDYNYSYFGFKTLEKSYLLKSNKGDTIERPQYLLMRVSIEIHAPQNYFTVSQRDQSIFLRNIHETYVLLSNQFFTHATPTMFHAGTSVRQLSSCYLLTIQDDSINGIYNTLKDCALISKTGGGIGVSVSNVRSSGSSISTSGGKASGIIPMLKLFNATARYVDQGGNKRPGAIAIYLEPWHADVFDFLDLRKNTGVEEMRARDLFIGLWIPDLFMRRVDEDGVWTLLSPYMCPDLENTHSEIFEKLYVYYETDPKFKAHRKQIRARELWTAILQSQIETGTPYMLFKDTCNSLSNQQHLGTIKSSNLCTEIIEYTSADEIAVCNLASVSLPAFVDTFAKTFDFDRFINVVGVVTRNLDKIIDINKYPVPQAARSNFKHRPLGIGIQGLANVFAALEYPFDSKEARMLNAKIFEALYFGALTASNELAAADASAPYPTYIGSQVQKGLLHFDDFFKRYGNKTLHFDWSSLRAKIAKYGVKNSLLIAPMPTATTAQILGNNESFEPFTSNLYTRRVLAGEFQTVNTQLIKKLESLGLWNEEMRREIIARRGSVLGITSIPEHVRQVYRTVWEIPQRAIIDMAADRAPFIDQSQSLNIHMAEPSFQKLTSLHFYAWRKGLKTGMYYLRTRPAADAIQFTVDVKPQQQPVACSRTNPECEMCSG